MDSPQYPHLEESSIYTSLIFFGSSFSSQHEAFDIERRGTPTVFLIGFRWLEFGNPLFSRFSLLLYTPNRRLTSGAPGVKTLASDMLSIPFHEPSERSKHMVRRSPGCCGNASELIAGSLDRGEDFSKHFILSTIGSLKVLEGYHGRTGTHPRRSLLDTLRHLSALL